MGKHSAADPPQRPAGVVVVVALVLGLALAGGLYFLLRQTDDDPGSGGSSSAASSTGTGHDRLLVRWPPRDRCASRPRSGIAPVVEAAADRVTAQNPCLTFAVTPAASAAVAAAFASGKDAPTAWVSDAVGVRRRGARGQARRGPARRPRLATSPLVFAVPATVAAKAGPALAGASWSALATGDGSIPVRLPDPETTTSGRLVLLSAPTALGDSPATRIAVGPHPAWRGRTRACPPRPTSSRRPGPTRRPSSPPPSRPLRPTSARTRDRSSRWSQGGHRALRLLPRDRGGRPAAGCGRAQRPPTAADQRRRAGGPHDRRVPASRGG